MRLLVILPIVLLLVVAVQSQRSVCYPNESFEFDCNTCTCNARGTKVTCTKRRCPSGRPGPTGRVVCAPGSTFKRACNDCRCNADGTVATCTQWGCI